MGNRDIASAAGSFESVRVAPFRLATACFLGWLIPGAGHWHLGRRARAIMFFLLVTVSFVLGATLHGRFSVFDHRQPLLTSLQVAACLGSGPMEIVARFALYGSPTYAMPAVDAANMGEVARRPRTVVGRTLRSRTEQFDSVFGTAYLWTAGLMNLLLILDVFDIGVGRKD